MFQVLIFNSIPTNTPNMIYEGQSFSVLLPGSDGEFEILDFHKPVISRLKKGTIIVDNYKEFKIKGGVAKMSQQKLVAMVDV